MPVLVPNYCTVTSAGKIPYNALISEVNSDHKPAVQYPILAAENCIQFS